MKMKLLSWNEAVKLAKEHDDYRKQTGYIVGLGIDCLNWGSEVDVEGDMSGKYYSVDNYAVPSYLFENLDNSMSWDMGAASDNLLRYGKIIADEQLYDRADEMAANVRIRIIKYNDGLYYHKMVNGQVDEIRILN